MASRVTRARTAPLPLVKYFDEVFLQIKNLCDKQTLGTLRCCHYLINQQIFSSAAPKITSILFCIKYHKSKYKMLYPEHSTSQGCIDIKCKVPV